MKALLGLLIFISLIYIASSPNLHGNTYTVYYKSCSDLEYAPEECPTKNTVLKIPYKALVEQQIVITGGSFSTKYDHCSVFDKKTWSCELSSSLKRDTITLNDGRLFDSRDDIFVKKGKFAFQTNGRYINPSIQQISRLEYTIGYIKNMF